MLQFTEENHKYESIEPDNINWLSVTRIIHALQQPFDQAGQAMKSSKNSRSKWYKMKPEDIIAAWDAENERSKDLGHWYHAKKEAEMNGKPGVIMPVMENGIKLASPQKLDNGIYPEHMVYLQSAGICGQSDLVTVYDGWLEIDDWKSNKEIRKEGYKSYQTGTQKMLKPIAHMDDCEFTHYSLQLSLYAFIIQRHNPNLKLKRMTIHHIQFEDAGQNQYGYPIHRLDDNGEPIVKSTTPYDVPYLQKDIIRILEHVKNNRTKIENAKH